MNKKLVRFACIFLLAALVVLVKVPMTFAEGSEAQTYSLNDVTSRTLSNSSELKLLGEKISLTEKRRDSASDSIDKDKKTKDIEDLREQLYQKQNDLEIEDSKLYYQILIKDQAINVQNNRVARLTKEYQIKQKQVELGNDTEASLLSYKVSVADAQAKLTSLKNEREKLVMSLNSNMGNDISTQLILKKRDIPDSVINITNLDQLAEDLSLKSYSVTSSQKLLDIDQRDLRNNKNLLPTATTSTVATLSAKISTLEDEILKLQYSIEDEQDAIEIKVRTDYNDVLNAKDTLNVKKLDYDKNLKLAQIAKLKYDQGLINYTEYSKAQEDADDALWTYQQATLDCYILTEQYKNYVKPAL